MLRASCPCPSAIQSGRFHPIESEARPPPGEVSACRIADRTNREWRIWAVKRRTSTHGRSHRITTLSRDGAEGAPDSPVDCIPESGGIRWSYGLTAAEQKAAVWLKPELVCRVRFTEWTMDGHLRHPAFEGREPDKAAREVTKVITCNTNRVQGADSFASIPWCRQETKSWKRRVRCGSCGSRKLLTAKKRAPKERHSIAFNDIKIVIRLFLLRVQATGTEAPVVAEEWRQRNVERRFLCLHSFATRVRSCRGEFMGALV